MQFMVGCNWLTLLLNKTRVCVGFICFVSACCLWLGILYCFSAYSRTSHNSESGMESDDLLFPIEEVVDNVAVENINSESGNMTNHAIYENSDAPKKLLAMWYNYYSDRDEYKDDKSDDRKMIASKVTFVLKKGMLFSKAFSSDRMS